MQAPAVRWLFAGYMLDESTLELSRDGRLLPIERKPLEVLLFMLQHSGEVVTKDELLAAVWPGRILSDTALAKCISRLRDVLADQNQSLIKTAHGYGYRFAGNPRTEVIAREAPPLLAELKAGDHPPLRPLWTLQERIGGGGGGDTWKVRHDKTGEIRVFKFAREPARLVGLKREITLYRLIKNTLEDEAPVVTLLDWNLAEPPYFIESRLADGGSLADWWKAVGGAAAVPLEERIELIARIADGLAAIHSIGVLHKDLKPSNVLLELDPAGKPSRVLLGDLGSGGVSDPLRMDAMGITRMGFTRTIVAAAGGAGTPMYLAPELLMGQPPTIRADIYALGVALYQLVIGDLARPVAAGWERSISDEVLRSDIARAIDGNVETRIGNAGELAERLRGLPDRRLSLDRQKQALAKAEASKRAIERMKARRVGLLLAIAALALGLLVSTALYRRAVNARQQAQAEAQRAEAVTNFLNQDMLARISRQDLSKRDLSVKQLLDSATSEVDRRFAGQADIAAKINESLGRSYAALEYDHEAATHLAAALDYYQGSGEASSDSTLNLAADLVGIDWVTGRLQQRLSQYQALLESASKRRGESDRLVLQLQSAIAMGRFQMGYWSDTAPMLEQVLTRINAHDDPDSSFLISIQSAAVYVYLELANYQRAEALLADLIPAVARKNGERSHAMAIALIRRGQLLAASKRFAEAQQDFDSATAVLSELINADSDTLLSVRGFEAQLALDQNKPLEAVAILREVLASVAQRDQMELDQTFNEKRPLAEALLRLGRLGEALVMADEALVSSGGLFGPAHPRTLEIRTLKARILLEQGKTKFALEALPDDREFDAIKLPAHHPIRARASALRDAIDSKR